MIRDEDIPELADYRSLENQLAFSMRQDYENLVVFGRNDTEPIHSWFRFKEGFSANLLKTVLQEYGTVFSKNRIRLLDPYCGSGTSLLSAQALPDRRIVATGIERSPFIHFVAQTKCRWPKMNHATLGDDGRLAIELSKDLEVALPPLSSISTGRCISRHIALRLVAIDQAARCLPHNSAFVRLGIAAAIEPLSRIRRDGRALRIVEKPMKHIDSFLTEIWNRMAADVERLKLSWKGDAILPKIHLGDGRNPTRAGIDEHSIDLILTSPPYPNNIDYSEVYKLELWIHKSLTH